MLTIDGAYGEGGGQILRTSLALATLLQQPICVENIRAGRKNPGMAAQHLTAVKAAAIICDAVLSGDKLGSTQLIFEPQSPPIPGLYEFDVADAREGGSAGAATLVLQTLLLPLALADGPSTITVRGGTHVSWSPSFHYFQQVYTPMLAKLGLQIELDLLAWGWYPAGEGEIVAQIPGQARLDGCQWLDRGALKQVTGIAVASSLPAHIAQRICNRAVNLLSEEDLPVSIEPKRVRSTSPGAGIFLTAEYENVWAGFSALGKKGKPSEQVAQEAVDALLEFHRSEAAIDRHLVDQLILPMAVSGRPGAFSAQHLTQHTLTNVWVVEQFLGKVVEVDKTSKRIQFMAHN